MTLSIQWSTQSINEDGSGDLVASEAEHILEFDAVVSEVHDATATLTDKAVERGASISDHKRRDPVSLTIEGVVTNTPLIDPPPGGYSSSTVSGTIKGTLVFEERFDRVLDVAYTLQRLAQEPTLVRIVTDRRTYEDMTLVSLQDPREPGMASSAKFAMVFREVRRAETSTIDVPQPAETRGRRSRSAGDQNAEGVPEEERDNRSLLARAMDSYDETGSLQEAAAAALGF